mgnify:CR=1 FL=1
MFRAFWKKIGKKSIGTENEKRWKIYQNEPYAGSPFFRNGCGEQLLQGIELVKVNGRL